MLNLVKRASTLFVDPNIATGRGGLEQPATNYADSLVRNVVVPRARSVPLSKGTPSLEAAGTKKTIQGAIAEPQDVTHSARNVTVIQEELQRVLKSRKFSRSPRLKQLLEYIIACWLAGDIRQLDGYNLAIAVFGRGNSFEPGLDPIVRVQVSRLRNHLADYYAGEGASNPLRIDIPKGTYIPLICEQPCTSDAAQGLAESVHATVMVLAFMANDGTQSIDGSHAIAISDHLIYLLTRTSGYRVISRISTAHLDPSLDACQLGDHFGAQFIIEGTVAVAADKFHVMVHLAETTRGYNLWSGRYTAQVNCLANVTERIYHDLLTKIPKGSDIR